MCAVHYYNRKLLGISILYYVLLHSTLQESEQKKRKKNVLASSVVVVVYVVDVDVDFGDFVFFIRLFEIPNTHNFVIEMVLIIQKTKPKRFALLRLRLPFEKLKSFGWSSSVRTHIARLNDEVDHEINARRRLTFQTTIILSYGDKTRF